MIVARIDGGLGNQMFQFAFALQTATRLDEPLELDLSSYRRKPQHGYSLDAWQMDVPTRYEPSHRLPRRYRREDSRQRPLDAVLDWLDPRTLNRFREKPFGFDEKVLNAPKNSYLVGYWQSEKFFRDVASQVRTAFQPRTAPSDTTRRLIDEMSAGPSIALHVRRGDYVSDPSARAIYRSLSIPYYYRPAVFDWLNRHSRVKAFVFTNDHKWCRERLALPCPVHYVDHTDVRTAWEDMWMMTSAARVVIANSTFSWWGAWLNHRPDKSVIAPTHWFHPGTLDGRHLNCESWITIDDSQVASAAA
ncbi:MAG: alpha-1,2-fucosyltransferase [Pirellulales bacterium]